MPVHHTKEAHWEHTHREMDKIAASRAVEDLQAGVRSSNRHRSAGQYGRAHAIARAVALRAIEVIYERDREIAVLTAEVRLLREVERRVDLLEAVIAQARLKNPSIPALHGITPQEPRASWEKPKLRPLKPQNRPNTQNRNR